MENENSNETRICWSQAKARLRSVLTAEELYWKQKAHIKWLESGDKNINISMQLSSNREPNQSSTRLKIWMYNGLNLKMKLVRKR